MVADTVTVSTVGRGRLEIYKNDREKRCEEKKEEKNTKTST